MVFKWVQLNLSTLIILHCYFLNTWDLSSPFFWHDRQIAESDHEHRHVRLPAWNNFAPNGRIFIKFYILSNFYETLLRIFNVH